MVHVIGRAVFYKDPTGLWKRMVRNGNHVVKPAAQTLHIWVKMKYKKGRGTWKVTY